jgi:hypothetical protein
MLPTGIGDDSRTDERDPRELRKATGANGLTTDRACRVNSFGLIARALQLHALLRNRLARKALKAIRGFPFCPDLVVQSRIQPAHTLPKMSAPKGPYLETLIT